MKFALFFGNRGFMPAELIAGARIPFDGKELTIAQLGPYKIDPDRATRRAAYCAEGAFIRANGDELDEIFDKLVSVRTKIAEALGVPLFVLLDCGDLPGRNEVLRDLAELPDDALAALHRLSRHIGRGTTPGNLSGM